MGLQGQLNDASSDSMPLLILALIANCFRHLRDILFDIIHYTGLRRSPDRTSTTPVDGAGVVGSGLASLVVLAEQLNLNKVLSYGYHCGGGVYDCFDGWLHHLNFNCPLCRSPLEVDRRVEFTRKRVGGDLLDWFSLR